MYQFPNNVDIYFILFIILNYYDGNIILIENLFIDISGTFYSYQVKGQGDVSLALLVARVAEKFFGPPDIALALNYPKVELIRTYASGINLEFKTPLIQLYGTF